MTPARTRARSQPGLRFQEQAPQEGPIVPTQRIDLNSVARASLIIMAVICLVCLAWVVRNGILLIFASAIAAIPLRVFADVIARWTRLPKMVGLMLATLLIVAAIVGACWLFGRDIAAEFSEVGKRATAAWNGIDEWLQSKQLMELGHKIEQNSMPMIGSSVRQGFSMMTETAEAAVILVVSALYLAAEPRLYRAGFIKLFAPHTREHASEGIDILGLTMKSWILGQLLTMLLVGVLSCIAALIIGVPGPIALGLIAFLAEAIPYLGPLLGGIPAVLVASTIGLHAALFTAGAYLFIHIVEGYLCAPLIQRYFVAIPPALMLFGITIFNLLFGTLGLFVAAPLTVVAFASVKIFYVRDTLHEKTALPSAE